MNKTTRRIACWTVNAAALVLAVTFLFSGWTKANDPIGTLVKLADYQTAVGLEPSEGLLMLAAVIALLFVEFSLGVCLLFGLNRRVVPVLTLVFMLIMTAVSLWLALTDAVSDCGCFGDALVLTNGETLAKNLLLLAAAALVVWRPRYQLRLISTAHAWLVSTPLMVGIVLLAFYSIYALPIVDFRPWHKGADIRSMTERPTLANRHSHRIHELDVAEFYALDPQTGDDLAQTIINERKRPQCLLIAPRLDIADQGCVGTVTELYDYCQSAGIDFYMLTASGSDEQEFWREHTGAEYSILQSDERMLRTMVRANPGLLLMVDGVVVDKWSNWTMPTDLNGLGN